MTDRTALITKFLRGTPWETWDRHPLAGDASARRYERLINGKETVILMNADPTTGQDTRAFAKIGTWLGDLDLCAPTTLLHDPKIGLMLIEDLGHDDVAKHLRHNPNEAALLYTAATDVLVVLDHATAPDGLTIMTPEVGGDMGLIAPEWYGDPKQTQIGAEMAEHLERHCPIADKVALRDYHAENLIWRPTETGLNRVGLLDYQDAFIAPRGYDLVSLLRDVRRKVDPALAKSMTAHFVEKTNTHPDTFNAAFACLAVQRNLRILGVFARLALRDNKTRYVKMIPHIWKMITTDLQHPKLKNLEKCLLQTLPTPENSKIGKLL